MSSPPEPRRSPAPPPPPVEVARPVERVLVVGAGIAGLIVANALTRSGVDCVVLEARHRVGGRMHTVDLNGSPVDLGVAQWHEASDSPLLSLARQAGIPVEPRDPRTGLSGYDLGAERRLFPDEIEDNLSLALDTFPGALATLRNDLGPEASVSDAVCVHVTRCGLTGDPARRARQTLRAVIEADRAGLLKRMALRWLWPGDQTPDLHGARPVGGHCRFLDTVAAGVDVHLGAVVDRVTVTEAAVRVRCTDGTTEVGSHVVMTAPLGVLRHGSIEFTPALPADRVNVISRLAPGRMEKVALSFAERFWRRSGLAHMLIFPREPTEAALLVLDESAPGALPTLVCQLLPSHASRLHLGAERDVVEWVLGMVSHAVGASCPRPVAVAVTSWTTDAFSRGAFTSVPLGAEPADAGSAGSTVGRSAAVRR